MMHGKRMAIELKVKSYITVVRRVMLNHRSKRALKEAEQQLIERKETIILRRLLGVNKAERIWNVESATILRWLGYVVRIDDSNVFWRL